MKPSSSRSFRVGWAKTRVTVSDRGPILDVGSGAHPNDAADVLCDLEVDDDKHRHGRALVVDRPFVVGRVEELPFRDDAFAFVIASHIAEHVDDPVGLCTEISRVGTHGYIETPSPFADRLLHEEYHLWRVSRRGNEIRFAAKRERGPLATRFGDMTYRVFNAGRSDCARPTVALPANVFGRAVAFVLKAVAYTLAKLGIMHTRIEFAPDAPLRSTVTGTASSKARVLFVTRDPVLGFFRTDERLLADGHRVETLGYDDHRLWNFIRLGWAAAGRNDVAYTFFAAKHALVIGLLFRLRGKRLVVAVGGYDTANQPEAGYGLAARRLGFVPRLVCRLADRLVAHSEFVLGELEALAPTSLAKTEVSHLAIDGPHLRAAPTTPPARSGVVTIASVTAASFQRKGIDRFVAAAWADADRHYALVGRIEPAVAERELRTLPPNLELVGYVDDAELGRRLWSSSVYVQLSRHETFGLALAEAMACGCTPVISDQGALLEVAASFGRVSMSPNDDVAVIAAAADEPVDRSAMRDEVLERFDPKRRKSDLAAAMESAAQS